MEQIKYMTEDFSHLLRDDISRSFSKTIVHGGAFHADETMGLALLEVLGVSLGPIERRSPSNEELHDPAILVLDIGGFHSPEMNNFDHHQNQMLPASCNLILEYFMKDGEEKDRLKSFLFDVISKKDISGPDPLYKDRLIEKYIKLLSNHADQFTHIIDLNKSVISSILSHDINTWKVLMNDLSEQHRSSYNDIIVPLKNDINNGVILYKTPFQVIILDQYRSPGLLRMIVKDDQIVFLAPNDQEGSKEFTVLSLDTSKFKIPAGGQDQTWFHPAGFFATYKDKQSAIDHVGSIFSL